MKVKLRKVGNSYTVTVPREIVDEMGLEQGLALERELQQRLFQSQDAREGIAAFVEKRKATFRGE